MLGCSGSFGGVGGAACSGYLLRSGETSIWMDCGNGTFGHLQEHLAVEDLTAVVLTHGHPDHCVDIYGLHVLLRYGLGIENLPIYAPEGLEKFLLSLVSDWGDTFDWRVVGDGDATSVGDIDLKFSRTDHPPPTFAVEASAAGRRMIYTADTGPDWSVSAFDRRRRPGALGGDLPRRRHPRPDPPLGPAGRGGGAGGAGPTTDPHPPLAVRRQDGSGRRGIRGVRRRGHSGFAGSRHYDLTPSQPRRHTTPGRFRGHPT